MKLLVLGLALLFAGCVGQTKKPDCYCDGLVINGVCDGVLICTGFCPLDGGGCRR